MDDVQLRHFSVVPFVAACGADRKNQTTANLRERVTCQACLHIIIQNHVDALAKSEEVRKKATAVVDAARAYVNNWQKAEWSALVTAVQAFDALIQGERGGDG